jgi:hypothetical protein
VAQDFIINRLSRDGLRILVSQLDAGFELLSEVAVGFRQVADCGHVTFEGLSTSLFAAASAFVIVLRAPPSVTLILVSSSRASDASNPLAPLGRP